MSKYLLLLLVSFSALGSVDCLRFFSKNNTRLIWKKTCNVIVQDNSVIEVKSVDACFGKYKRGIKTFFVFNSDLDIKYGPLKKSSIILEALSPKYAHETSDNIYILKETASPELFRKYQYILNFDKQMFGLTIRKYSGIFSYELEFDLDLQCK